MKTIFVGICNRIFNICFLAIQRQRVCNELVGIGIANDAKVRH